MTNQTGNPFRDPEEIQARARAVHDLLDGLPHRAVLYASETRVGYPGRASKVDGLPCGEVSADHADAVFDAVSDEVSYLDADGVRRSVVVPRGATAPAVAAMAYGLGAVREWMP